jgi:hypothetical protein
MLIYDYNQIDHIPGFAAERILMGISRRVSINLKKNKINGEILELLSMLEVNFTCPIYLLSGLQQILEQKVVVRAKKYYPHRS